MTRQILNIVIAFVVALGLWVYVVTVVGPEYEDTFTDIPVTFIGEPADGLEVHNKQGHKVTLKLSGNRSDLNKLSVSNISVTVDLSQISQPGSRGYRYEVSFPGNVPHNAVIVQSQEPASIMLSVGRVIEKYVPFKVQYNGPTPDGYVKMQDPELEDVFVRGPEEIVSQIEYAGLTVLSEVIPDGDITGTYGYKFYDKNDQEVKADDTVTPVAEERKVMVTYPIRAIKKITLSITPKYGGGIDESNASYTISPGEITVQGMPADLKKLDTLNLGVIDFSVLRKDETINISIEDKLAEISKNLKVEGQTEAEVKVTLPDLAEKSFHVTQFREKAVPENTECTIETRAVKVTVRGSKEDVEKLTVSDIQIIVDYTGVTPADYEQYVKATATILKTGVSVAVIEMEDVRVTVKEIPDETDPEL